MVIEKQYRLNVWLHSYSLSIATVAVSLVIFGTFSVK